MKEKENILLVILFYILLKKLSSSFIFPLKGIPSRFGPAIQGMSC